jgi:hypothetical protein
MMSDMASGVVEVVVGRDTRTTVRWSEAELAWLEETAAREGVKVGAVVRSIVRGDAMGVLRPASSEQIVAAALGGAGGVRGRA